MTTATDILTSAAKALGYLGRTEVLSAGDANDALVCFNRMLDSWSNEKLMSYPVLERSFSLIAGTQTYTIGVGPPPGYINSTRPYDIVQAFVRDFNQNDYPVKVIPRDQWNDIGAKYITSQIPDQLFYDPQFPLGVINIFPVPLIGYTVFFDSTLDQVDQSSLVQAIQMPVGYERAYVFNLALDMMSMGFPCMLDDKGVLRLTANAMEAKGNIKRANMKEVKAGYDQTIVARSNATYNIYSDSATRS